LKVFTNGGGKIMLGKVPSGYKEKKELVQVFRKERGKERERERERERGGIGATFEQGNDFFLLR
jgi:hypothetical protein